MSGHGPTRDQVEVIDEVGRRTDMGLGIPFWWVKAYIGILGNEWADLMAKRGCQESLLPQVMEGGIREMWKGRRSQERAKGGLGMGRIVHWNLRVALWYTYLQVGKYDIGKCMRVLGVGKHLCGL